MAGYAYPHLDPHQSRTRPPSDWETALADTIEAAFARGAHDLDALIAALNLSRVRPPHGGDWTSETFTALMHELGA